MEGYTTSIKAHQHLVTFSSQLFIWNAKDSERCDKPAKNLDKNSDPPIINPIIREKKKVF